MRFLLHAELNATKDECFVRSQDLEAKIALLESRLTLLESKNETSRESFDTYDDVEYNVDDDGVGDESNQGLNLALFGGKNDLGRMGEDGFADRIQQMLSNFGGGKPNPRESLLSTSLRALTPTVLNHCPNLPLFP